jgi:hypothetical protein
MFALELFQLAPGASRKGSDGITIHEPISSRRARLGCFPSESPTVRNRAPSSTSVRPVRKRRAGTGTTEGVAPERRRDRPLRPSGPESVRIVSRLTTKPSRTAFEIVLSALGIVLSDQEFPAR